MRKEIKVVVANDGEITIEASGYKGGSCLKATAGLRKDLVGDRANSQKKPEFYQPEIAENVKETE
jgi:hypothetical protein